VKAKLIHYLHMDEDVIECQRDWTDICLDNLVRSLLTLRS
jgi:hypothetical protein